MIRHKCPFKNSFFMQDKFMMQRRKIIVIGKIHIPLGALRRQLKVLAKDKNKERIFNKCLI